MNPPTKPADNLRRVQRGGSWNSGGPSWVSAASRYPVESAVRSSGIGFRCALRGREPRV